jgi:UDPglucose--hexose-1-phosphate uridylyltransferase
MTFWYRTDVPMSDGRTLRYYDREEISRTASDQRPVEVGAGVGIMRLDPLLNEWIAIATHRQHRAFLPPKELCPLCPTDPTRGDLLTEIGDKDFQVVVFDNKNPALNAVAGDYAPPALLGLECGEAPAVGKCEVVVFSDHHEGSFGSLSIERIELIMAAWQDRTRELSATPNIFQVFPFENRGEEVGVTIHHPHGQIYAYGYMTPRTEKMLAVATAHKARTGRVLLDDIIAREIKEGTRIVAQNDEWIAYVPYAARYPFEIHVAPLRGVADLAGLDEKQSKAFAPIAKEVLQRLDGVFQVPMPYMAAWHQAPVNVGRDVLRAHWQITSVRRAPGKLKYLAGSESAMGAFVMDLLPEQSAKQLQDVQL